MSEYEDSIAGGLEIRYVPSDDWLLKGGARTMTERKVKSASLQVMGNTQGLSIINPYSYSLTSIYLDTGYCWESFHIFFGASYNIFKFKSPGLTVPYRAKNGSGANFGIGAKINENWSLEYASHSAGVAVESGTNYQTSDTFLFVETVFSLHFAF